MDRYSVGKSQISCSTMHKIHEKEFTLDNFSTDKLITRDDGWADLIDWWQMIQLSPSSYNQKRTVMLNYEVLANIYKWRKDHKLDEWHEFCERIEKLPYSELITGEKK